MQKKRRNAVCNPGPAVDLYRKKMRLNATDKKIIAQVEAKIKKDFTANYSIEQLATWSGIGAAKLKKGFQLMYGMPIYQYILHAKMKFARNLIDNDELTLTQIARLCGYNYTTNFIAAFKKLYGQTPGKIKPL